MRIASHPNCCGIECVSDLGFVVNKEKKEELKALTDRVSYNGRLKEIVLNQNQKDVWGEYVESLGYILSAGFINGLHNSTCYVYHYHPVKENLKVYGQDSREIPRQERRLVEVEIYAICRDGLRKGPFYNRLTAETLVKSARKFHRREIYSDGTSSWTEV